MPRQLQPCGTTAAYDRHRRRHEEPCDACRKAWNTYMRNYRAEPTRHVIECGTPGGYRKHLRSGEQSCDACRAAHTAAQREYARTGRYRPPDGWAPPADLEAS